MRAVNLIPSEQRSGAPVGAGRSEGAAYAVLALIAAVAVLALLYGIARHHIASSRSEAASLTQRAQQAQAETSQLAPYTAFAQLREQRQEAVSQLVDTRFDWAHAFHEIGRVLPPEASLSSLTGTVGPAAGTSTASASAAAGAAKSSSVTSATPPGSVPLFTLSGCATSQRSVALLLERLRLIDGVSEVTLQSSTRTVSASSSGGGSGSGACPSSAPVFNVQVAFAPLPTPSAATQTTTTVAASSSEAPASRTAAPRAAAARTGAVR